MPQSSMDWWIKHQPLREERGSGEKRRVIHSVSPHLSNLVIYRWHLLVIFLLRKRKDERKGVWVWVRSVCSDSAKSIKSHRTTFISQWDAILNIAPKELIREEEVENPWLGESVTWSSSDWAALHLQKIRLKGRHETKAEVRSEVRAFLHVFVQILTAQDIQGEKKHVKISPRCLWGPNPWAL